MKWTLLIILTASFSIVRNVSASIEIYSSQVFVIPVRAEYFNWSSRESEYRYEASLQNYPDLPTWINYTYSQRHRRGYLYGVAPNLSENVKIQVTALDLKSYETRDSILQISVLETENLPKYEIQLRISNLNLDDMFDNNRTDTLFDVFKKNVWRNASDMQLSFLAPSVDVGGRYPLKPGEVVGTVVRIASSMPFSSDLKKLEQELEPTIKKFDSCTFEKVSMERFFREAGFEFDWCYFRLMEQNDYQQERQRKALSTERPMVSENSEWRWLAKKSEIPVKNYRNELLATALVPVILLLIFIGSFTTIVCLHHEDLISSNGIMNKSESCAANGVQMIQYASASNRGTLSSLSIAQSSNSPILIDSQATNRNHRSGLEIGNSYVRPNPPPYNGASDTGNSAFRADF